jgi:transcriptional regulator with XRE-family HTH domain/Flp pilus assembly protein TadD
LKEFFMSHEHVSTPGMLPMNPDIGARLRHLRRQHGLSQRALGEPKLSGSYVSLIERGKLRPTMPMVHHFAARLGVPLRDLLDPEEDSSPKTKANTGGHALASTAVPRTAHPEDQRHHILLLQAAAALRLHRWPEAEHLFSIMARTPLPKACQRWYVLYRGESLWEQGRFQEALALLTHLVTVTFPEANDDDERFFHCHLHLLLGQVYRVLGHFKDARDVHRQSLEMLEKDKETALRVILETHLAYDYLLLDAPLQATTHACFALDALDALKKSWDEAGHISVLAQSALHQSLLSGEKGDQESARESALQSLELATVTRAVQLRGWLRCVLAYAFQQQGKLAEAEAEFHRAIGEASAPQAAFDWGALVVMHCCLAALLLMTGNEVQAVQEARAAQTLSCMQPDDRQMQALVSMTWAVICAEQGEEASADAHFLKALHFIRQRLPTAEKAGVFSRFQALLCARKQIGKNMSDLIGWWAMRATARL